jgi:hypothetical protein
MTGNRCRIARIITVSLHLSQPEKQLKVDKTPNGPIIDLVYHGYQGR